MGNTAEIRKQHADDLAQNIEHTLFAYPNPRRNFGPQFTPADDPAPADSHPDMVCSSRSTSGTAAEAGGGGGAESGYPPGGGGLGGVSVACP